MSVYIYVCPCDSATFFANPVLNLYARLCAPLQVAVVFCLPLLVYLKTRLVSPRLEENRFRNPPHFGRRLEVSLALTKRDLRFVVKRRLILFFARTPKTFRRLKLEIFFLNAPRRRPRLLRGILTFREYQIL